MQLMKRNVVKQDYGLVNARYKLSTVEIKFILAIVAQINMDDRELKNYTITIKELEEITNAQQNETRLKHFAKRLMSKPLEVETPDGWAVYNWFSKIEYKRGEAKFNVNIHDDLKPYLIDLKKRFVKFNLMHVLPMQSKYSIRLYQLLKEYEKLTKRTFTVKELQELLQVPKSLLIYNRFKEKVLKVAEKEMIAHADIFFEFEEVKEGRRVNEILFRIKRNAPNVHGQQYEPAGELPIEAAGYKNKVIYFNGRDWRIVSISTTDDPSTNVVHIVLQDIDSGEMIAEQFNIQRLKLMVDQKEKQPSLF